MNDITFLNKLRTAPTFVSPDDPRLKGIKDRDDWYEPRNDEERLRVANSKAIAKRLSERHKAKMRVVLRGRFVHMHKNRRLRKHGRPLRTYPMGMLTDQNLLRLQVDLLPWRGSSPVRIMGESEVRLTQAL